MLPVCKIQSQTYRLTGLDRFFTESVCVCQLDSEKCQLDEGLACQHLVLKNAGIFALLSTDLMFYATAICGWEQNQSNQSLSWGEGCHTLSPCQSQRHKPVIGVYGLMSFEWADGTFFQVYYTACQKETVLWYCFFPFRLIAVVCFRGDKSQIGGTM